jgi:hypothetical protein
VTGYWHFSAALSRDVDPGFDRTPVAGLERIDRAPGGGSAHGGVDQFHVVTEPVTSIDLTLSETPEIQSDLQFRLARSAGLEPAIFRSEVPPEAVEPSPGVLFEHQVRAVPASDLCRVRSASMLWSCMAVAGHPVSRCGRRDVVACHGAVVRWRI